MKFFYFFIFLFLFSVNAQSQQEEKDKFDVDFIKEISTQTPKSYFDLFKLFSKYRFKNEVLEQIIQQSGKQNNKLVQIFTLNQLGINYRISNHYQSSIQTHLDALALSEVGNLLEAQIHTLNMLGVCYNWNSDLKSALESHQKVLKLASGIKNPSENIKLSIAIATNSIGGVYNELKQYQLAIDQFEKAIKIHKDLNNKKGLAINYSCLGHANEKIKNYDKALSNYSKSLVENQEAKLLLGIIICNVNIAKIHVIKGEYDKANKILNHIYEDAYKLKVKKYFARFLSIFGLLNLKQNHLDKATIYLMKSLDLFREIKVENSDFISLNYYLSELYDKKGNKDKAFSYYKDAVEYEKKLFNDRNDLYVSTLISKYDLQSKKIKIEYLQSLSKMQLYESSRNKNILIIILISLALLSVALYSIYRQRLLNNDKKVLTLEQQALQSQMNPHFIFNALNSIKLYIINNEQKEAVYYLNKFSKLIRNILDVSKNKYVSLKEELETMSLYLRIENIRFNNEIEYITKIDETLSLNTIKVPPLILQPFLENALWHGLSSKKGKKEIILNAFKVSKNIVEITISDNGIGRDAAMKIKKEKSLNRKSVGIGLTLERLKTFSNEYTNDFSLKYYDLKDDQGKSKGTRVVLRIPLN